MRRHKVARCIGVGLVVFSGAVLTAGCFAGDCKDDKTCPPDGEGGGGGGTPAGCVPSEPGWTGDDACGVFVALGGTDGTGKKAAPVSTLEAAFTMLGMSGGRVYVCAERFEEAIVVPGGVTVYGGLDCANGWAWVGETRKTEIIGPPDVVAVRIAGGTGVARLEDVAVQAVDAVTPGASSIAVLVDQVSAELVRCDLRAGNATMGPSGAPGAEPDGMGQIPQAAAGMPGNAGQNACTDTDGVGGPDASLFGGLPVLNDCGGGLTSLGGGGGNGNINNGSSGSPGEPGALGAAGTGEPANGAWSCATAGAGQGGDDGMDGIPGAGATGTGTLTTSGYVGVSGSAGTPGQPGQGGGGGGGAKGSNNGSCPNNTNGAGASGGSGGAGGCGGQPGQGGGAGGASIALASVNASVTLASCSLTAGNGGPGGAGGNSQVGGAGGLGGPGGQPGGIGGLKAACSGGDGGQGGNGGPGGGGLGGPSAAIAYVGTGVTKDAGTTLAAGAGGEGGPGGDNDAMISGAGGVAVEELEMLPAAMQ